ncbi:hypothetical protein LUZ62_034923 [Rhynchospora pubera]|uniref:DUF8039 domain-containing protein n=1 Tax=Rhynchospora pubera TaxID=906938 RepID=A0AAV8F0A7_9POAL|nr:hypothetical protein LUZ62_034923 [Rhynchospora pubera]
MSGEEEYGDGFDEEHNEGSEEEQNITTEKECRSMKRSRTTLEQFRTQRSQGTVFEVEFDKKGCPIGIGANEFATYYGFLAKENVPITTADWRKVPKKLLDDLWEELKKAFNIKNDDAKKKTIMMMGKSHKCFRSYIYKRFIVKSNPANPENPCDLYNISTEEWEQFVNQRDDAAFQEKRRQGQEKRRKFDKPHRMGSHGYRGAQKNWKDTDIIVAGDSEEPDSSVIITAFEPRTQRYLRARAKKMEKEGYFRIPSTDKATLEVFHRAQAMSEEVSSGTIRPFEALNKAIGTPEHPGGMRGCSAFSKKDDLYVREPRKSNAKGTSPEEVREIIRQEMEVWTRQISQMLASKGFQMPQSQPLTPHFVPVEVDSGYPPRQSIFPTQIDSSGMPPDLINDVQEETPCTLYSYTNIMMRVQVAEGRLLPSSQAVNNVPLAPDCYWVYVDRVSEQYRTWDTPRGVEELLVDVIGNVIQWPKVDVVLWGQDNQPQRPREPTCMAKVPSETSGVGREPLLDKKYLDRLNDSERSVYEMLMLQPGDTHLFMLEHVDPWGTHTGEVKFSVSVGDILECLKREQLSISILKMYSWFWKEKLTNEFNLENVITLDPDMVSLENIGVDKVRVEALGYYGC